MTDHDHVWCNTAVPVGDGVFSTPCQIKGCDVGYTYTFRNFFPSAVSGVSVDIEDHPSGAVAKLVCFEATHFYKLDTIPFKAGDVAIDVGAHVGVISCYLAKAHPEIRIIALEPVPYLFDLLRRNLAANGARNVTAVNAGVSGDGAPLELRGELDRNSGGATGYGYGVAPVVTTAATMTWDQLCTRYEVTGRVRLLKIDCEGAEHGFLTDAALAQVDYLCGEFHDGPQFPNGAAAALAGRCELALGKANVRLQMVRMG